MSTQTDFCARRQLPTQRHGRGGGLLCAACYPELLAKRQNSV
ncbi:hypothetical protein ACIQ1S_23840 [Streptomyces griseus]